MKDEILNLVDDLINYEIPTEYAYALTNADVSGLSDDDIETLNQFEADVIADWGNAFFMHGGEESFEPRFETTNDVTSEASDVVTLYIKPSSFEERRIEEEI